MRRALAAGLLAAGLLAGMVPAVSANNGATVFNFGTCVSNGVVEPSEGSLQPGVGPAMLVTNKNGPKVVGPASSQGNPPFLITLGCWAP